MKLHLDVEPSGISGMNGEISFVSDGDCLDDGQTETEPFRLVCHPIPSDALERLE